MGAVNLKKPIVRFVFLAIVLIPFIAQAQDAEAFDKIDKLNDNNQKIEAYKKFAVVYPSSEYKPYAYFEIFSAFLDMNQVDSALYYADLSANSFPVQIRFNTYNNIAFALAQKKVGLDTAAAYIQRAVSAAKDRRLRNIGMYLDTQALVMFDLGNVDSALSLEQEAIAGHEEDPSYISSLSIYQEAAGKRIEGIKTAAKAILLGSTDEALSNFNKWLSEEKSEEKDKNKIKDEIVNSVLNTFLSESKNKDTNKVHSTAAAFLAATGVNLTQANNWAKESLSSINDNSTIEDKVMLTRNYAIVLAAENKSNEAIKEFSSVENLADPWDGDFWYSFAKTYQKIGDNKKALALLISGSVAFPSEKVTNALKELESQEGISNADVQKLIEKKRNDLASFDPGHFSKKTQGKVVLAELFTGAECPPCAGADAAFDALSEYFPRNDVAILEYHLHIPAPDPMTNPDTFARYKFYGGNFGTPTVILEGKEKITGGGPKYVASNRFNIYKYSIDKYLKEKPEIKFTGTAVQSGNEVKVNLLLKKEKELDKNFSLHIALVEKSIHFEGSNGVTKHIFVVRDLLNGAKGNPLTFNNDSESLSESFDLAGIGKNISSYLDDPTKDSSWRRGLPFSGWKQRTDKIDRNNLAVVVWVQNDETKDVLQSFYVDVRGNSSSEKVN